MSLRPVASLWIGDDLRWIDRLSLASFVHHGHEVTLYHTAPVAPKVPEGVRTAPASEVWGMPDWAVGLKPAALSDIFRLHLLTGTDAIWVDTDVMCLRPFEPEAGYLVGYEESGMINGAVLALPPESKALVRLCAAMSGPDCVPDWLPAPQRAEAGAAPTGERLARAVALRPNILGPAALSHMLPETGEAHHVLPTAALNPVPWGLTDLYFNPYGGVEGWLTDETRCLHLYASRIRALHWRLAPYPESWLARFAAEIGFDLTNLRPRA